jgi:type VI secretion system protein ImpL
MLEAGSLMSKAETSSSTFIVAGNELNYQISTGSIQNPFNFTPLREFRCPSGI